MNSLLVACLLASTTRGPTFKIKIQSLYPVIEKAQEQFTLQYHTSDELSFLIGNGQPHSYYLSDYDQIYTD